jgi:23S rRNA (cytidine1920-2'-O)/16S rRNA (cytidine1409-2'-O)-methyltransferase
MASLKNQRLDAWLVQLGLSPTRTKAQRLIAAGEVEVFTTNEWRSITKSSTLYTNLNIQTIRIRPEAPLLKYVSRGGLKLEGALRRVGINPKGFRVLDIGISTGGFSDCLLEHGCAQVIGVDVGHGQLDPKLRKDPRIQLFEGINVRNLAQFEDVVREIQAGIDLCVVDVSFISLLLVLPVLFETVPSKSRWLVLVKPQFELGASALDKNGVVRDSEMQLKAVNEVLRCFHSFGFMGTQQFACDWKGQDGNQEYFIYAKNDSAE